jgi:1-acyl-sn-glycerol-3-phosphate acyltransferase
MNLEELQTEQSKEEHIIQMWEPLAFETEPGYDYHRNGFLQRLASILLRGFADIVLAVLDRICFGLTIGGRKNKKLIRGRGAVTICNHIHPMDCTMVDLAMWSRRMYYVTLESNFRIPLIRHFIRMLGGVPLPTKTKAIAELFDEMGKALRAGSCVQIYPETVLHPYFDGLRRFEDGAFHLAVKNRAPILPIVVSQRPPRGLFCFYKHRPCLHLEILPPIEPDASLSLRDARKRLKQDCQEAMAAYLEEDKQRQTPLWY